MIKVRGERDVFGDAKTHIIDTGNPHCFAFLRANNNGERLLVICNFSEHTQHMHSDILRNLDSGQTKELLTNRNFVINSDALSIPPLEQVWLAN